MHNAPRTLLQLCTVTLTLSCCIAVFLPTNPSSRRASALSEEETILAYLANGGHERVKKALDLPEEVYYNPIAHFSRDDAPLSSDEPPSVVASNVDLLRSMGYYLPGLDDESVIQTVHRLRTASRQLSITSEVRGSKSLFTIQYLGGPPEGLRKSFEFALGMWADQFACKVPLRVVVKWGLMQGPTLAAANSLFSIRGRSTSSKLRSDTAYTPTMAAAVGGKDYLPGEPHIEIQFNSRQPWHFDLSRNAPPRVFDLATVALHELCHGLFFSGAILGVPSSGRARYLSTDTVPGRFDQFMQTSNGIGIARSCNSRELYEAITTPGLRIRTTTGNSSFGLYAPPKYQVGSSTYHFDGNELERDCQRFNIKKQDCSDLMTFELNGGYTRRIIGNPVLRVMKSVLGPSDGLRGSKSCNVPEASLPVIQAGTLGFDRLSQKPFGLPPWVIITVASVGAAGAVIILLFVASAIIN